MQAPDDFSARLAGRLSLRRRLTAFANLVEAGALDFAGVPPSRRAPLPVRIVLTGEEPRLEIAEGEAVTSTRFELENDMAATLRKEGVRKVDLILDDGAALDLSFALPEASFAELRQMIFHEIAYQSPFEAEEARWCWTAERRGKGEDASWHVDAALALAERVEPVLAALRGAGIRIACVRRRSGSGSGARAWAALPSWAVGNSGGVKVESAARGTLSRGLSLATKTPLAVAVPVLATLAFFGLAGTKYASLAIEDIRLSEQTEKARAAIAVASRQAMLRRRLEQERHLSALRLAAVGNVAASLPDDTWLASFAIESDELEIAGFGPSAARTTEDLAEVPGLGALRFAAPIARNSRQQTERFRLAAPFGALAEGETR